MKLSSRFVWLIGIALVVNLLWMNDSVTFWDEDEAAYAGFGIEMLASGDWVNPDYKWSLIHRKTPLHFWTIALSYKVFGINEFAVRFPCVLAILLTCWLVYRLGRTLFGEQEALGAAVILATSIQLPLMGKIAFTDATLLCCETLAVLSLLNYIQKPSWKWNLGLWLGIMLGVLVKGPPIILLTGGIWLLLAIFHPLRKNLIGTHPWFFGLLILLPFVYWCYLSYSQDYALWEATGQGQDFETWWWESETLGRKTYLLPFLWDWYVMKRIGGSVLGQSGFFGYHFVVLTIAFLTWLPFWFSTLKALFASFIRPSSERLMLVIWIVIGWFFWELMSSKLPSYSIAAQPALALLMSKELHTWNSQKSERIWFKLGLFLYGLIFGLVVVALPIVGYYLLGGWTLYYLLPMVLILGILLIRLLLQRKDIKLLTQNLAIFGAAFMFLLWTCIGPIVEQSEIKSFYKVAEVAYEESNQNSDARVILSEFDIKQFKISLIVYLRRKFPNFDELFIEEAIQAFKEDQPTVLIIGQSRIEEVKRLFEKENIPFDAKMVLHRSTDDAFREHNFWIIGNSK